MTPHFLLILTYVKRRRILEAAGWIIESYLSKLKLRTQSALPESKRLFSCSTGKYRMNQHNLAVIRFLIEEQLALGGNSFDCEISFARKT